MARKTVKRKQQNSSVIAPQVGSQELAMNSDADLIIYGGAAKP